MAQWPENGTTDWNTKMKANIDVGHDSDGTHTKAQMLTDMEWSPSSYAGEESVTFPNGLVFKHGTVAVGISSGTVTFDTAFSTGLSNVQVSPRKDIGATGYTITIANPSTTSFEWGVSSTAIDSIYWQAWGY